jgi:hypothetical protein
MSILEGIGDASDSDKPKRSLWTNDERVELIKLRLQGLAFEEIGNRIGRTKHAARSEYGRIRRGETDVEIPLKELPELLKRGEIDAKISLSDFPELLKLLPVRKV